MGKTSRARPAARGARTMGKTPGKGQQSLLEAKASPRASARATGGRRDDRAEVGFGGPQVCTLVHISYRQLDYWARTGLLKPSLAAAKGSGTKRRYSYRDLVQLKVIKQLLDAGISLQSARRAIECLRTDLGEDLASSRLVLTGSSAVLVRSDGDVVDLLAGGQGVFNIIPMSGLVQSLDADIVALGDQRPSSRAPGPQVLQSPGSQDRGRRAAHG